MNPLIIGGLISAGGSIAGSLLNRNANRDANTANADLQREFAQKGIQWRVADAKAAGIHPLAALGVNVGSARPTYTGGNPGAGITGASQSIGSAVMQKALIEGTEIDNRNKMLEGEESLSRTRLNYEQQEHQMMLNNKLKTELEGQNPDLDKAYIPIWDNVSESIVHVPNPEYFQDMQGAYPNWWMQRGMRWQHDKLPKGFYFGSGD